MRVAIIGAGSMGARHAALLSANHDVELVAFVEPMFERGESERWTSATGYRTIDELLRHQETDAWIVAAPPAEKPRILEAAIEAGIHCLIEKPISNSIESARRVASLASRSGLMMQVGFYERFNTGFLKIRDVIESGDLGCIRLIRTTGQVARDLSVGGWKASDTLGGGALFEAAVHSIDTVRWLTGSEFKRVYAEGRLEVNGDSECIETVSAVARMSSGAMVDLSTTLSLPSGSQLHSMIEIVGSEGTIKFNSRDQPVRIYGSGFSGDGLEVDLLRDGPHGAYQEQLAHFVGAVLGDVHGYPTLEDGVQSLCVANAISESVRGVKLVKLAHD
jgi:myo-inositol 2-dehydrogenase/D-chiro-inositol 1-dehydrogenase